MFEEQRKVQLLEEQMNQLKFEIEQLQNKFASKQEIDSQYKSHFQK